MLRSILTALAICIAFPNAALAIPVRWEVHGLFPGGATTAGSFTVDVDTEQFWGIDITSTPGPAECYDGSAYYACTSPGAHFTDALYFSFFTRDDGQKGFREMIFLSEGPASESFVWHARWGDPRFDGACASAPDYERPEWCFYGPGNEGGSWGLHEDSEEEQCGGVLHCGTANNSRRIYYQYRGNYMVGTVIPIPPAVWLFGSALSLIGVMRRKISS